MSIRLGPTRLIVIRSGKYDYGEIDLSAAVHLVGPNNVGKTSLISLLQLLYIDKQQNMSFSRPLDESKRYYFPDTTSYVIFEVLTPSGYQVITAHGLGKIKRNDFERFTYQGKFDPADFLDADRRVRDHRDVQLRLADRGFTTLKPSQLRAALTGIGEAKGVHLGLVPIRHRDHYPRFRTVFQHLLRLSQIRQKELKALLLDLYRGDFRKTEIVLAKDMADRLNIIRKGQTEIHALRALSTDVTKMLEFVAARRQARIPMPAMWLRIGDASIRLRNKLDQELVEFTERKQDLIQLEHGFRKELTELDTRRQETVKRSTLLERELGNLDAERDRFKGFVLEFKQQEQAELQKQIADLHVRLHAGRTEDGPTIKRRLTTLRRSRKELSLRLDNLTRSIGVDIATLLPDADKRQAIFKILDARLLQLPRNETGITVTDKGKLESWLAELQRSLDASGFRGQGVHVNLSTLPAPDLAQFLDADRIEADLTETDHELARHEEILAAITEAEQLDANRARLQDQRDVLVHEIGDWHQYQSRLTEEPVIRTELEQLVGVQAELKTALDLTNESMRDLKDQDHELASQIAGAQAAQQKLSLALAEMRPPEPEWSDLAGEESPVDQSGNLPFDDLARRYQRLQNDQFKFDERVKDRLRSIENRTYDKYPAAEEEATIAKLQQEIEALPEREAAIEDLWRALTVDLRSSFKALWQDLELLKGRVTTLNRQLAQATVSNLEQVRLLIEERQEWGRKIQDMLAFDEMPLFADQTKTDAAVEEVGKLLDQHEKIQLSDLFGFRFEITTTGGQMRRYENLDSIESNGTTITIKVLINVLLLRELINREEVQIPFYLDEASSLDFDNLAAIVAYSQERGFVPVLASPDPMEAAEHLYFISEVDGRVVLDPEQSRVTLKTRKQEPEVGGESS